MAEKTYRKLMSTASQLDLARLRSVRTPESGARPSSSLGTLLDSATLRITIAQRTGADVCEPHRCRCGAMADSRGHHALSCRFSAGRQPRHTALNDIVRRALQSAGVPSLLEPAGIDEGDGRLPNGMTIFPFSEGKSFLWDATCVKTYATSYGLSAAAATAGAPAKYAEERKVHKYSTLANRHLFQPVAFETSGTCGPATRVFVRQLGARLTVITGDGRETA